MPAVVFFTALLPIEQVAIILSKDEFVLIGHEGRTCTPPKIWTVINDFKLCPVIYQLLSLTGRNQILESSNVALSFSYWSFAIHLLARQNLSSGPQNHRRHENTSAKKKEQGKETIWEETTDSMANL